MKILYAAAVRLPTEKAHGVQIVRTCEALVQEGAQVELMIPGRATDIVQDPFAYYGLRQNFSIIALQSPDAFALGRLGFWYASFQFARQVARHAKAVKPTVIYSRDKTVLVALCFFAVHARLVWEVHGPEPRVAAWLLRKVKAVVISQGLKNMLVCRGFSAKRVLVAHDGVELSPFVRPQSRTEARARLGLPSEGKIAMYVGRLDGWKGVDTLLAASELLTNVTVAVIGGEAAQVKKLRMRYPRVQFLGYRPYAEVADNEAAADVLVLPNTGTDSTSRHYTSPLKLFTYMASGIPMVVSDLPSIREVVSEGEAFFAAADNPRSFAEAIQEALHAPDALCRAKAAREKVQAYTWEKRAQRILAFI